jgi:hypothetical protein
MASKYIDPTAIMQVIGCVFNNPHLLDFTDKYTIQKMISPTHFTRLCLGQFTKYTN